MLYNRSLTSLFFLLHVTSICLQSPSWEKHSPPSYRVSTKELYSCPSSCWFLVKNAPILVLILDWCRSQWIGIGTGPTADWWPISVSWACCNHLLPTTAHIRWYNRCFSLSSHTWPSPTLSIALPGWVAGNQLVTSTTSWPCIHVRSAASDWPWPPQSLTVQPQQQWGGWAIVISRGHLR